ncbi:MAG: hypothetical protein KGL35_10950 [Bradyrhizobium sp.]|nr:hypothetical protein [Bradyrhizobium sp.]
MIFVFPVTIPANTPQTAPVVQQLQLTAGKITRLNVQFPSGVVALAHVQLSVGLHQLYPTNPDADFATSNETITWDEDLDLDTGSNVLTVTGWNTDTVYQHTITIRVMMELHETVTDLAAEIAQLLLPHTTGG